MKILALETTGEACSCALIDSDGACYERQELAPRRHTRLILGMVEAVLRESAVSLRQLDSIALSHGPGSFTGVRIGVSVAQGLALGADLPITPVSSLRALAQGGWRRYQFRQVLAAFDARLEEIYAGAYALDAHGLMQACVEDCLISPDQWTFRQPGRWTGMGSAWPVYEQQLRGNPGLEIDRCLGAEQPLARDVAQIGLSDYRQGLAVAPDQALPNYLRQEVARPRSPLCA